MRYVLILSVLFSFGLCDVPEGYQVNEATGHAYKLMYVAQPWHVARDMCKDEGAKLAVPKNQEDFDFVQRIVRGMHYPSIIGTKFKLLVWVGINNMENHKVWRNIDGENIDDTGFHKWANGNGIGFSADPKEPHCVGMDAVNPGLRDYWCTHKQAYICEIDTKTETQ